MPTHLIISPPASGKTHTCLERVRAAAREHPFAQIWVLVPDQLQADAVRARLAASGQTVIARVATFQDLSEEILERAGRELPLAGESMLHRLLQEVIRSLNAGEQIPFYAPICTLPGFLNEARDRIAELKRSQVSPQQLAAAAQAETGPGMADLARIYAEYQARLQASGWTDLEGASAHALEALVRDATLLGDVALLVVDGFENFNPTQLSLLHTVAGRAAETWITLPGTPAMERPAHRRFAPVARRLAADPAVEVQTTATPPHLPPTLRQVETYLFDPPGQKIRSGSDLVRIEARSPDEEAREALRWLKARILREGLSPAACAVAVPDLATYRAPLREAADEFGLPLHFNQGPLVSDTPLGAAVSDLLSLAALDYPLRPLLDTIRSPYFDLSGISLQPADAKLLEIASRFGQVVQGWAQWEETLQALSGQGAGPGEPQEPADEGFAIPRLPTGELATRLLAGLRQFAARIAPPAGEMSYRQWSLWLADLLENLGLFDRLADDGENGLSSAFDQLLWSLAHSETLTGECLSAYEGFLKEWEGLARTISVTDQPPDAHRPAIRVMRLMEARAIRADALAVLGLAEGIFPAIERADPFLGEEVRRQLGMEARLGQEQAGLFYQVATRADRFLLLTQPYLARDGESWEASPYWNALQELLEDEPARIHPDQPRPFSEAASPNEVLFWAARRWSQTGSGLPGEYSGALDARWQHIAATQAILAERLQEMDGSAYDGGLSVLAPDLGGRYGERAGWSASRLEAYATCPFWFFTSSALGLEVIEPPQIGYQANQLGSILHAVLEQVYREAADPADTGAVLDILPEVARRVFATAPWDYQFRPSPLWETQQDELLQVLQDTVLGIAALDAEQDWRPLAFEARFGLEGQPPLVLQTAAGKVRLHGLVDRVDVNPDGKLRVIDYKSGSSHLSSQDLIEGRRLQLPIYALAASQALGLGEPVEGFYWKLFQGEMSAIKLSRFQSELGSGPEAAFREAIHHVETIVSGARQGAFRPQAPQGGCPSYCAAAAWCWHYHAVRW